VSGALKDITPIISKPAIVRVKKIRGEMNRQKKPDTNARSETAHADKSEHAGETNQHVDEIV
jgi:hypothetical protein